MLRQIQNGSLENLPITLKFKGELQRSNMNNLNILNNLNDPNDPNSLTYGIIIPKLNGSSILYKNLNIFTLKDQKIIEVNTFDYRGNKTSLIETNSLELFKNQVYKKVYADKITNAEKSLLTSKNKTLLIFFTQIEAYIQKLTFIDNIKDIFYSIQLENEQDLFSQIPSDISQLLKNQKSQHPEILL